MRIFAIGDLHLAISVPEKTMEVFGPNWANYMSLIEERWKAVVERDDLVLLPGDISWAMSLDEALIDLCWIDALPGTKLILKGNHDYWWPSFSKLKEILPPSMHALQNNAFHWQGYSFGGSRLWDTQEYGFGMANDLGQEKIYDRELMRLEMSLKLLDQQAKKRIALTHYPPIGLDLQPTRASHLLEKYSVDFCVFGHLHNLPTEPLFGTARGVTYKLVSSDYLRFTPLQLL